MVINIQLIERGKREHGWFYRRLRWARVASTIHHFHPHSTGQNSVHAPISMQRALALEKLTPRWIVKSLHAVLMAGSTIRHGPLAASTTPGCCFSIYSSRSLTLYPPFTHLHLVSWEWNLKEGEDVWGKHFLVDWFRWSLSLVPSGRGNAKCWLFLHRVILWAL